MFSLMFGIVFLGYTISFYIAFGLDVAGFRNIPTTILTLIRFLMGEFYFYQMYESNRVVTPILFVSYSLFCLYCLLNMFLAILNESYSYVADDMKKNPPDFSHLIAARAKFTGMLTRLAENKSKAAEIGASLNAADVNSDGLVDVNELCNVLKAHRADLEAVNLVDADDMDDSMLNDDEVMAQARKLMDTYDKSGTGKLDTAAMTAVKEALKVGAADSAQLMSEAGVAHGLGELGEAERHELQAVRRKSALAGRKSVVGMDVPVPALVRKATLFGGPDRGSVFGAFSAVAKKNNRRVSMFASNALGLSTDLMIPAPLEDLSLIDFDSAQAHGYLGHIVFDEEGLDVSDAQIQARTSV